MIHISDTQTGIKTIFKPHEPKKVSLYVCGITPYDYPHIGHGRCYVFFDVVYRFLTQLGYTVTYCRNYTDIDDKLLKKSIEQYQDQKRYLEVASRCISQFQADMEALNCIPPTYEPRVTENIDSIITFIEELIDKKHAYVSQGSVYFSIETFPAYGKLSHQNKESLIAGTRHDIREEKKNPLDFALWKAESEDFFWKSPWGTGRPGWHIECSALARKYLGAFVDIHGGGLDLIFPHHENEIAQSESLLKHNFVTYWLHVGLVMSNEEKMSKSLGNFIQLKDLFTQYNPMVLRYYYLSHHYRAPLPFSYETMEGHAKAYKKLCTLFSNVTPETKIEHAYSHPIAEKMIACLRDDFNTAAMLGVLFEQWNEVKQNIELQKSVKMILQDICGLTLQNMEEKITEYPDDIKQLLKQREKARTEKNWARADEIRKVIEDRGYQVQDKKAIE